MKIVTVLLVAVVCQLQWWLGLCETFPQDDADGSRHLDAASGTSTLVSYINCQYDILDSADGNSLNLTNMVNALVTTYNTLMEEEYDDPYSRLMSKATLLDTDFRRRNLEGEGRRLFLLWVSLEVVGTCVGCSSDMTFSLDLSGRRRLEYQDEVTESGVVSNNRNLADKIVGVPTEQVILEAYSLFWAEIASPTTAILDVLELEEVEGPVLATPAPTKATKKSVSAALRTKGTKGPKRRN
eukprot:Nitzschia sp. Nitz4//scaffold79_size90958//57950//58669//NITZ4_005032-RA/size90958-processed-gene-0.117-mRNA-1//-1//CDS//3329558270//4491//frame0